MIEVGCVLALSGSRGLDLGLLTIDRAYEIVFLAPIRAGINGSDFEAHKMTAYPLPTDVLQNPSYDRYYKIQYYRLQSRHSG